jgi:hypothetical protein
MVSLLAMMWKRILHYQVFNRTIFYSAPEGAVRQMRTSIKLWA